MNQLVHTPQQLASFVDSLLIPITGTTLLLPVSAVSEVMDDIQLQTADDLPAWLYGTGAWREHQLQVICYEALVGAEKPAITEQSRLAVLKAADENSEFEYYGIVTQGYPRSARVTPTSDFRAQGNEPDENGVLMYATLDDQAVIMPDLAEIEQRLQQL
ncbi:chemotaxis protein CheW [Porticoccus sp. W117]|uniref:chemotaxis protein CheW n=1 Tax=Porticoccus sp. W117 TaxID=3054777 RepID=UPI002592CA17|nr:chemotaxis protein CheW [Porticoccus sp. W117]MDM3872059.1 chemotaxis protein CheW [Porticoccus sp. W117]